MEPTESRQEIPLTHICYQPFNVTESPSQRLTDIFEKTILTGGNAAILSDDEVIVPLLTKRNTEIFSLLESDERVRSLSAEAHDCPRSDDAE